MSGRELRELIGDEEAYVAGPEELDPDAGYSVAASELLVGGRGGRTVGKEPQALAWFLAR
jgi:hypothetical protein